MLLTAPPRSRGWTRGDGRQAAASDGSPALAGMDPRCPRSSTHRRRLPRARGDGPLLGVSDAPGQGAPPRSRGWTHDDVADGMLEHGSPALAGMDPRGRPRGWRSRWLPRARGDGPSAAPSCVHFSLAPPRSRGWTHAAGARLHGEAGSPALAGMDPVSFFPGSTTRRLPRARGDGPVAGSPS